MAIFSVSHFSTLNTYVVGAKASANPQREMWVYCPSEVFPGQGDLDVYLQLKEPIV